jgi:hypothetical protein
MKSIFLAGPTPREKGVESWRPEAVRLLTLMGFDGEVFVPEQPWEIPNVGDCGSMYDNQIEWEQNTLDKCMAILMWVPRELKHMPAFTTNVEFGLYVKSGNLYYGRPLNTPKTGYLDHTYRKYTNRTPPHVLEDLVDEVVQSIDAAINLRIPH